MSQEKQSDEQKFELYAFKFRSISHPSRLKIISCIYGCELSVGQIGEKSGIMQPSLSQHLGILREGKVLNFRRESKKIYYSLSGEFFEDISNYLEKL
jgi:DNA-binding transcriptional ArsR family regulator